MARVLARAGYRVREAGSAAAGLAQAREAWPDLIFLDLHLPDQDGTVVLQQLRDVRPQLAVVMMSVEAAPEAVRQLCELGAHAYLEKPCAPTLVLALAETLLCKRRVHSNKTEPA